LEGAVGTEGVEPQKAHVGTRYVTVYYYIQCCGIHPVKTCNYAQNTKGIYFRLLFEAIINECVDLIP